MNRTLLIVFLSSQICRLKKALLQFSPIKKENYVWFSSQTSQNRKGLSKAFGVLLVVLFANLANAQTASSTWALTGNGNPTNVGNVAGTSIAIGSNLNTPTYTPAIGVSTVNWSDDAGSLQNNEYYEFKVTPNTNTIFNVTAINFEHSRSNGDWQVRAYYSTDGFLTRTAVANAFSSNSSTPAANNNAVNLSIQNQTLSVRIYGWESDNANRSLRIRNVVISGTTCTIPAAPSSVTNGSRCGIGPVNLAATAGTGQTIDWYAASSGGTALSTANSNYTTPSIAGTTIYYAEARDITGGCVSATRTPVTATVNVAPVVKVDKLTSNICAGQSVTLTATGDPGTAVTMGGSGNNYMQVSGDPLSTTTDFTFETMLYWTNNTTDWQRIFDFGANTTNNMFFTPRYSAATLPRFAITTSGSGGEQQINGTTAITTNTWHHLAITYNAATTRGIMYLDGAEIGRNNGMTITPAAITKTLSYFGKSQYPDPYLAGSMDEIRLWNVTRTPAEITANKTSTVPFNSPGLVAYYKLNEGTGTLSSSAVGSSFVTLSGSPTWITNNSTPFTSSTDSFSWTPATGLNTSSGAVVIASPTAATTYIVANTYASCTATANAVVNVSAITAQPAAAGQIVCRGSAADALTITAVAATGYSINSYQWYSNNTASNVGGTAVGTNSDSYTPSTATAGTLYYYCVVAFSNSCTVTSAVSGAIAVNARPAAAVTGSSTAICNGGSANISGTITAVGAWTLTLSNGGGTVTGTGSGTWSKSVSPTGNTTYGISSLVDSNCTSIAGDLTGSQVITVNVRPVAAVTGSATAICNGGSTNISGTITAAGAWTLILTNSGGTVTGTGSGTWTKSVSPTANTTYGISSLVDSKCTSIPGDLTGSQVITVNDKPAIATISAPAALCPGASFNPAAPAVTDNGSTVISQGWEISTTSGGTSYVVLTPSYIVASTDNGKNIRYKASNGCGGPVYSNVVALSVSTPVITPTAPVGTAPYTFTIDNPNAYTTPNANGGQYALINVVKGFTYIFSVGDAFSGSSEVLTILDAANANVSPAATAAGSAGATITNWVSSLSGQIKVVLTEGNCVANGTVGSSGITVTLTGVNNTQDNQLLAGNNSWIGHVYNIPLAAAPATGASNAAMFSPSGLTGYAGYYTEAESFGLQQFGGGSQYSFPIYSNGGNYTNIDTQGFAVRYRMTSTKPQGCYLVTIKGDDGTRLYVNNAVVANLNNWGDHGTTTYASVPVYFSSNSTDLVFDYYENGGISEVYFNIVPYDQASNVITPAAAQLCSGAATTIRGSYDYDGNPSTTPNSNPSFTFSWESNTDGAGWVTVAGVTSLDYTPAALTTTTNNIVTKYRRTATPVSGSCGTTVSNEITITTSPSITIPAPVLAAATNVSCTGFTANWASVNTALNYKLDVSTSATFAAGSFVAGYNGLDVGLVTTYNVSATSGTTYYYRVRAYNACASNTSADAVSGQSVTTNSSPIAATTQVGATQTFCTDNGMTFTSGNAAGGQYVLVNVIKGFTYTFSAGNAFSGYNENITILDAATDASVSPAVSVTNASGVTITNWVSSLSGQIKVVLSAVGCNTNGTAGTSGITVTQTAIGNTQETQNESGTNTWVGHIYNAGGGAPNTFDTAHYAGYYTVPAETITENFGSNTNCFAVYSGGTPRASMYAEGFAVRYKMNTTRNGCFLVNVRADDGVRLYLNGTAVVDKWNDQSATSYNNTLVSLDGNDDFVLDYYENGVGNEVSFSITPFDVSTNIITPAASTICSGTAVALNGSSYLVNGAVNPSLTFQWESSSASTGPWTNTGVTTEDYSVSPTITTYYRRVVKGATANNSGCSVTSAAVVINVNTPAITNMTAASCSAGAFTVSPANVTNGVVPSGTTYTWTAPSVTGITGTASGTNQANISGTPTNITNAAINVVYTVTPVYAGCTGTAFTVTVTVNPKPAVTNMTAASCSASAFTVSPANATNGIVPSGTTYSWSAPSVTGITGTASGTNQANISGTLTNTTSAPINVAYTVTPAFGTCTGSSFTVTVTINPLPNNISNGFSATTICAGGSPELTFDADNSTFSGPYNIVYQNDDTLIQYPMTISSSSPQTFPAGGSPTANTSYKLISITNATCTRTASFMDPSADLYVRPMATATITGTTTVCAGASSPNITFTNPRTVSVTVTYKINGGSDQTINIGVGASNTSTVAASTASSGTFIYNLVSVVYQDTPTCSNTITGQSATVTVNAPTAITAQPSGSSVCETGDTSFTVAASGSGLTYQWQLSTNGGGIFNNLSNSGVYSNVTAATMNITAATIGMNNYQYRCVVSGICAPLTVTSNPAVLNVTTDSGSISLNGGTPIATNGFVDYCPTNLATFSIFPVSGATSYVWVVPAGWKDESGVVITGLISTAVPELKVITGTIAQSGDVFVTAANISGSLFCPSHIKVNLTSIAPSSTITISKIDPTCAIPTGTVTAAPPSPPVIGTLTYTLIKTDVIPEVTVAQNSGGTFTGLAVGDYVVTYQINSGCYSARSNSVTIVPQATNTWTTSGWSTGIPTLNDFVVFDADYSDLVSVNSCSCKVNTGKNVTIASGKVLTVVNDLQVDGTLTFKNGASLIQKNENPNPSTLKIVYERTTSTVKDFDYVYWSSPVEGQKLGVLSPSSDKYWSWSDYYWVPAVAGETMIEGKGYIARVPRYVTSQTVEFKGTPNNGDVTIAAQGNAMSNLIGNPYPSAIDAEDFMVENQYIIPTGGMLAFWTHTTKRTLSGDKTEYVYEADDYGFFNLAGGIATNYTPLSPGGSAPDGTIAAGQSFMVGSETAIKNIFKFTNSMRIGDDVAGSQNGHFFRQTNTKKTAKKEKNRIWLNLTNEGGAFKQLLVGYITGATNDEDRLFDGTSRNSNAFVDFYSIMNEKNYSIQGRGLPFDSADEVPLGYKSTIEGTFQIGIDRTDGFMTNQAVYLEDKTANVVHDLSKGSYSFATAKGEFKDRFVLRYTNTSNLGTGDVDAKGKGVIVSVKNSQIKINSFDKALSSVKIYDLKGSLLFEKSNVNKNEFIVDHLISSTQFMIVTVQLEDGKWVSEEIIFHD